VGKIKEMKLNFRAMDQSGFKKKSPE